MCGTMNVRVELWPVAADSTGIWLVSGRDAWRSPPVPQDSDPHFEVESILSDHDMINQAAVTHSTSWRADGPHVILTYIVVVEPGGDAITEWPEALPISHELLEAVGRPPTNAATDAPIPRYIDVLVHGIRHLRFLLDYDATAAAAIPAVWRPHLNRLQPTLAGLYSQRHSTVDYDCS